MAKEDKFADELLTEDELEQVAGGTYAQTSEDSKFLSIYGLCPKFTAMQLAFTPGTEKEEQVKAAWATVGVILLYNSDRVNNAYFMKMNGILTLISREAAYQHVFDTLGDPLSYIHEHHT